MIDEPIYELQETIRGVTFIYREPGVDPAIKSGANVTTKSGDFEDVSLRASGDPAGMLLVDAKTPGQVTHVLTSAAKGAFWRYEIDTRRQEWKRRAGPGPWSPPRPVSDLWIRTTGEIDEHSIGEMQPGGPAGQEGTLVIYPGSTCRMVWNPATRRYTLVCS